LQRAATLVLSKVHRKARLPEHKLVRKRPPLKRGSSYSRLQRRIVLTPKVEGSTSDQEPLKFCEHERLFKKCRTCNAANVCEHWMLRLQCNACDCSHGKPRGSCAACVVHARRLCKHGVLGTMCLTCTPTAYCRHGRLRETCHNFCRYELKRFC